MSHLEKQETKHIILKIIVLLVFLFLSYLIVNLIRNTANKGEGSLTNLGPVVFPMMIFTLLLLAIGYIIWDLFGDQISAPLASFLLQSGEKITKPKYYSKARALLVQNKTEEAIKTYEKILDEDEFDITAYCELADIYHEKLKDYSAALNCYEKIEQYAQETTDTVFAINRKVDIYLLNDSYPNPKPERSRARAKAIEELEKIIKKFPKIKDAARAEERIKNLKKDNIR